MQLRRDLPYIFLIPFIAQADALISNEIAKGAEAFFTAKDCVTTCQKTISGTSIEITRVDINFDNKAEYRVALTDCGSAGCPASIFMYREGAWIKLIEGWGMHVLRSKTKGVADLGSRGENTYGAVKIINGMRAKVIDMLPKPATRIRPTHGPLRVSG